MFDISRIDGVLDYGASYKVTIAGRDKPAWVPKHDMANSHRALLQKWLEVPGNSVGTPPPPADEHISVRRYQALQERVPGPDTPEVLLWELSRAVAEAAGGNTTRIDALQGIIADVMTDIPNPT